MVRFLPLIAVLLAWAPDAFAVFPPYPRGMGLLPLDGGSTASNNTPWFTAAYTELRTQNNPDAPKTGKCEDRRPVVKTIYRPPACC
jgi:hypothetical protein